MTSLPEQFVSADIPVTKEPITSDQMASLFYHGEKADPWHGICDCNHSARWRSRMLQDTRLRAQRQDWHGNLTNMQICQIRIFFSQLLSRILTQSVRHPSLLF